ncbi:hypothetical protein JMM81_15140 [Bacillus sp. V3B]|uniref:hypothetical protein n=1 Tax=Bacillus sp. V3B TaxID=2804915 RepID=UPI00210B5429|nr:hypothetical protein [Bacillus sp. V3B]MCQ6276260.1 hypothetical protein [Bacillus sp. V3B]
MRIIAGLFSILMPGFGQMYNKQFLKGVVLLAIEHYNNITANINKAIFLDFNGYHQQAIEVTNFGYLLFYPGFYVYTVWDAWYHAKTGVNKMTSAIPFIIAGFIGEFGTIFAPKIPFPTLTVGLSMIIPMILGMIIFRNY